MGDVLDIVTARTNRSDSGDRYVGVEDLAKGKQGLRQVGSFPSTDSGIGFEAGDILIGNIRPYLKKIWLADFPGGTNGDVLTFRTKRDLEYGIDSQFMFQVLSSERFWQHAIATSKGTKMPRGDKASIMKFEFPLVDLQTQTKIAQLLGRFEMLVNEQKSGLPAEISARRKQYEHYRNQLLTFKELVA